MRNLLHSLKIRMVVLPLLRIAGWLRLMSLKRALTVDSLLLTKLEHLIRLMNPESLSEGYDEEYDKVVYISAKKLRQPHIFEDDTDYPGEILQEVAEAYASLRKEYEKQQELVDTTEQNALKNSAVKRTLADYCRIRHFIDSGFNRKESAEYHLTRAKDMGFAADPIKEKELYAYEKSVRTDIAELRYSISEREAVKVDLSIPGMTFLLAVASSLFLISGYLYNQFLLGSFGVDVSYYFTVSDYISSSISKIGFSFSAAAIGVASYFFGVHSSSRKSFAQVELERRKPDYWKYVIVWASIMGAILNLYLGNIQIFYSVSYLAVISTSLSYLPKACRKYFKRPDATLYTAIFVISLFTHLWSSTGMRINELRTDDLAEMKAYDIAFSGSVGPTSDELLLVASNSNYYFLLDDERRMHVIGKASVRSLQRREPAGPRWFSLIFPTKRTTPCP